MGNTLSTQGLDQFQSTVIADAIYNIGKSKEFSDKENPTEKDLATANLFLGSAQGSVEYLLDDIKRAIEFNNMVKENITKNKSSESLPLPLEETLWGIHNFIEDWKNGKWGEIPMMEAYKIYKG